MTRLLDELLKNYNDEERKAIEHNYTKELYKLSDYDFFKDAVAVLEQMHLGLLTGITVTYAICYNTKLSESNRIRLRPKFVKPNQASPIFGTRYQDLP